MSMHNLGIPDLPEMAFQRDARGHIRPQGGKGKTPKQPDYVAAAQAEAQGNLDLARYATQANRVNQYTPWGSLTYTNDRTFDQAGYDAAMAAYNRQQQQPRPYYGGGGGYVTVYDGSGSDQDTGRMVPIGGAGIALGRGQNQLSAPNRDDFWSGGDNWSQHIELSPELQAQLDQQNRLQQGLFGAQDAALNRVNQTMSQGFNTSALPSRPTALDSGSLTGWGSLGDVLNINSLPGMGTALDINSLPEMAAAFQASGQGLDIYDPNLQTNNATELIMQRLNPQLDQQQEALRAQLANQGIVQGTEAYDRAMMQHQQARNDAQRGAALEGINLGMQQQGLQFGQGLSNRNLLASEHDLMYGHQQGLRHGEAGLQNQQFTQQQNLRQLEAALQAQRFSQQTTNNQILAARRAQEAAEQAQSFGQQSGLRGNAFQEQAYLRNLPMQELGALTGSQVQMPQFPGYSQQATTGGPQLLNAAQQGYQGQLGAYNAQQAAGANTMGGLFGLGNLGMQAYGAGLLGGGAGILGGTLGSAANFIPSLAFTMSDRRLKKNIKRIGTADNGLGIYSYQYVWGGPTQLGYMADEVERIAPHAVGEVNGFKTVNYGVI